MKQKVDELQAEIQSLRIRLTEFAGQLLQWAEPKSSVLQTPPKSAPAKKEPDAKNAATERNSSQNSESQQFLEAIAG